MDGSRRLHQGEEPIYHLMGVSCFAEHVVVSETSVLPVPDGVPPEIAAIAACAAITGVGAVLNVVERPAGRPLAVFGAGGVGLAALAGAALTGAHPVIAIDIDIDPAKLDLAQRLGATYVIDARDGDVVERVLELSDGGVRWMIDDVRDALLWNDNRSAPDAEDLIVELGGTQAWVDAVGSVPVASMTVSKIRWLARVGPANADRTASVLLPHDWLTWQLGGRSFQPVTDRGDASGTLYFDATGNGYREDLVRRALGHNVQVPRVAAPDEIVGSTPGGMAIAAGTGDNMAAGLGLGLLPGEQWCRWAPVARRSPEVQRRHTRAQGWWPASRTTGGFLPLVCTLNGARNLGATAQLLGVSLEEMSRLALTAPPGSQGLTFVPYLEGSGPHHCPMRGGSSSA